jgi:TolB-like protein/AraC-like DNA-binding protein/Tfp pilus assembly protein PilF
MDAESTIKQEFIKKLRDLVDANISDENFGVKELAKAAGMNYFHLNRKLHSILNKNTSQFIREIRLERAKEILEQEEITAAEVAYKAGFGSPAYFSRCFHEYYGYPPGETKNRKNIDSEVKNEFNKHSDEAENPTQKKTTRKITVFTAGGILILFTIYLLFNNLSFKNFSILQGNRLKSEDKSIAVLPFISLSSDEENQYFADGVSRDILYNLIQISEIKVINNPIEELDGNAINLKKMAGKLNVRFFLAGSVQKSGEQILIMVQLTDISKNQIIWSEKYIRKLSHIFQIQSDIANQVAANLETVITKKEKEQIEKMPTQNMEAHAWYVIGRYLLDRRGWREARINKYITPFKNAIAADSNYAEAYIGLADVYLIFTRTQSYPKPEGYKLAKENISKALKLDNNLAEAHASLGTILYQSEWKWDDARKELEYAIELNPNHAQAHRSYANLMAILRQKELARFHYFRALELNPVSPYLILWKADILAGESKFDEAMADYNKFIEMYPENYSVYWHLWEFFLKTGEEQQAVESLQKAFQLVQEDRPFVDTIKVVYDKYGIKGLDSWLNEHKIKYDDKGSWQGIVRYYNKMGEKEKALEWLEKAFKWKTPNLPEVFTRATLDNLRNEPRFKALIDSMGLTPYYTEEVNSAILKK